jgi:hypothetical protein
MEPVGEVEYAGCVLGVTDPELVAGEDNRAAVGGEMVKPGLELGLKQAIRAV